MKYHNGIPIIDLSPLQQEKPIYHDLIGDVRQAYTSLGFAYFVNHNVPEVVINNAFSAAREFHALPLEEKMRIKQNPTFRGYMPPKGSFFKISYVEEAKKANASDAFIMGKEVEPSNEDYGKNLSGPNQWPDTLPNFKKDVMACFEAMNKLARQLLHIFILALEEDLDKQNQIRSYFSDPNIVLRLQHYPPQKDEEDQKAGLAAHTDYGAITILNQDCIGGLQVQDNNNEWISVPPLPGSVVINTGDMIRHMTGGKFKSTRHRVISNESKHRHSIPFFYEPSLNAKIKSPTGEVIFYGSHLMERVMQNYPDLGASSTFPRPFAEKD